MTINFGLIIKKRCTTRSRQQTTDTPQHTKKKRKKKQQKILILMDGASHVVKCINLNTTVNLPNQLKTLRVYNKRKKSFIF